MKEVRITPKKKEELAKLGLYTSEDILSYYPYRYESIEFLDYALWQPESRVVFEGRVVSKPAIRRFGRARSIVSFDVETEYSVYKVSLFNQPWYLKTQVGSYIVVIGKYEGNNRVVASSTSTQPMQQLLGIRPVYSLKDRLKPKYFSQLMQSVLEANRDEIEDFLPADIVRKYSLMPRYEALKEVHFPTDSITLSRALNTLKYEEFFRFQIYMLYRKQSSRHFSSDLAKKIDVNKVREFTANLPFELTHDQKQAINEIFRDLTGDYQMCRLLQGDVGSGKTIVAFTAMYAVYLAGYQACIMAPTEILAKQHYRNMTRTFEKYGIGCELLHSGMPAGTRKEILARIESGQSSFIVGTHALFQDDVKYKNLGLIITDEQHRFGVRQRQALQDKGIMADLLLMSATPIPRTLASSLYGDMDVSTITETPNKGKTIHTRLIRKNSFFSEISEIEDLLARGNQMYVVCAAIEKNSDVVIRNVVDVYNSLSQYFEGRYSVGLLHGQQSQEEKDAIQQQFADGLIDIMVTTTVVEVGVDVKKANIMIIYDANRFGLSQLHQLRGRIGRGESEGYCYLLTASTDEEAISRLQIIAENTDGFQIAYYDLQQRGPGDILGYRQSGMPAFVLGNVINDSKLLNQSRNDAKMVLDNIDDPQYAKVREYLSSINEEEQYYPD